MYFMGIHFNVKYKLDDNHFCSQFLFLFWKTLYVVCHRDTIHPATPSYVLHGYRILM
jgi:hypothetical protein